MLVFLLLLKLVTVEKQENPVKEEAGAQTENSPAKNTSSHYSR